MTLTQTKPLCLSANLESICLRFLSLENERNRSSILFFSLPPRRVTSLQWSTSPLEDAWKSRSGVKGCASVSLRVRTVWNKHALDFYVGTLCAGNDSKGRPLEEEGKSFLLHLCDVIGGINKRGRERKGGTEWGPVSDHQGHVVSLSGKLHFNIDQV